MQKKHWSGMIRQTKNSRLSIRLTPPRTFSPSLLFLLFPLILVLIFSILFFLPISCYGEGGDGDGGELIIDLSNSTLEANQTLFVNLTLTAANNTGNISILVRDPLFLPVLIETAELTDGSSSITFSLFWWHPNGTYTVNATARTSDNRTYNATGATFRYTNWTETGPDPIIPEPDNGDGNILPFPLPPAPLLILTTLTVASFLLAYSTEKGKFGLWLLLVPLYTRLRKSEALEDFNRGRIFRTIEEHPGIRYSEIRKQVGIGNGVLTYHLKVLQSMRYVKGVGDKTLKRFYLWGAAELLPPDLEKPFTPIQLSIVDFLSKNTWSAQKEIAASLQIKQQTLSKNLKKLEQGNIVKRAREGNSFRYKLSEGYVHWLDQQISPKCPTCMNVCRIGARFCENCGTKLHET